jgi:predicted ATP-binding protein involved in virulence
MGILSKTKTEESVSKTFGNTDSNGATKNVKDIVFWGNGDTFKLISKASSQAEGWMKSTKAMEIEGIGCVIQVTTQQGSNVAEALTYVPGVRIREIKENGEVIAREIINRFIED